MGLFRKKPKSGLSYIQQIKELEKLGYQALSFDHRKVRSEHHYVVEFQGSDGQRLGIMWIEKIKPKKWQEIIEYVYKWKRE